jgi:aminoglycoside N3'-acetyltransferase
VLKIVNFFLVPYPAFTYLRQMSTWWRKLVPTVLKGWYRTLKKQHRVKKLRLQQESGGGITAAQLKINLESIGIRAGDHLMVHASMSKMGYIEGGAHAVVRVLKDAVGKEGTLLMPTSPVVSLQFDYARTYPVFDVRHTPSAMGQISEVFRTSDEVVRSLHPTEPVAAWGNLAGDYVKDHTSKNTPYHSDSPFAKLMQRNGKILYIGVTLDNAGTHLHTLEDAVDVNLPVYCPNPYEFTVIDYSGKAQTITTKIHNPEVSRLRRCDELLPLFFQRKVCQRVKIGQADSLLFDAAKMFETMVEAFQRNGVTMYNPQGNR